MDTLHNIVRFLAEYYNYILVLIIFILLIKNFADSQEHDKAKKESFKLICVEVSHNLIASFCVKHDTEVDLSLFCRNIIHAIHSSKWNPENISPDDPELINLERVLLDFGYYNVVFRKPTEISNLA